MKVIVFIFFIVLMSLILNSCNLLNVRNENNTKIIFNETKALISDKGVVFYENIDVEYFNLKKFIIFNIPHFNQIVKNGAIIKTNISPIFIVFDSAKKESLGFHSDTLFKSYKNNDFLRNNTYYLYDSFFVEYYNKWSKTKSIKNDTLITSVFSSNSQFYNLGQFDTLKFYSCENYLSRNDFRYKIANNLEKIIKGQIFKVEIIYNKKFHNGILVNSRKEFISMKEKVINEEKTAVEKLLQKFAKIL